MEDLYRLCMKCDPAGPEQVMAGTMSALLKRTTHLLSRSSLTQKNRRTSNQIARLLQLMHACVELGPTLYEREHEYSDAFM